ncbi:protein disulfide-isomerase precursor [Nowakowskiella sp. JEL0407]|nr:protein disulfide-isomerase precursor [Nowakowskiella sp. JEL0407]
MHSSLLFALVLFFCKLAAANKLSFTDLKDFEKFATNASASLVYFYANNCNECLEFDPIYNISVADLTKVDIPAAYVNCDEALEICEKEFIGLYPTLKMFTRDGNSRYYDGQLVSTDIVSKMKKLIQPAVHVVNVDSIKSFRDSESIVAVGFFDNDKGIPYRNFLSAGDKLREDFTCVATFDKDAVSVYNTTVPSILLFRKFDKRRLRYRGNFHWDHIVSWVKVHSFPTVETITPNNHRYFTGIGIPIGYFFYADKQQLEQYRPLVERVAPRYNGKITFVYIDAKEYLTQAHMLNIKKKKWPAFVIHDFEKDFKYVLDGEILEPLLKQFVDVYLGGTLMPTLKTERIPLKNEGPIYKLVGENFNDIVWDKSKDVLVLFCTPLVDKCKDQEKIFLEVSEKVKSEQSIRIAQLDVNENDMPPDNNFKLNKIPTIKLYKAESNERLDYNGDYSLTDILEYLKYNAVNGKAIELPSDESKPDAGVNADGDDEEEGHDEL